MFGSIGNPSGGGEISTGNENFAAGNEGNFFAVWRNGEPVDRAAHGSCDVVVVMGVRSKTNLQFLWCLPWNLGVELAMLCVGKRVIF